MEGLDHITRKEKYFGSTERFLCTYKANVMEVAHLLCADDSLVFCGEEVSQIRKLRAILTIFEGVSGLHANWQKSCLYTVN